MDRRKALKPLVSTPGVTPISVTDLKPNDNDSIVLLDEYLNYVCPDRKIAGLPLKVVRG